MNGMRCRGILHSIQLEVTEAGGGVTVLISAEMQSEGVSELTFSNVLFEVCAVKLFVARKIYLIMGIYRSPSGSVSVFNVGLAQLLSMQLLENCKTIISGDFNIDIGDSVYPATTYDLVNEVRIANFHPLITIPTRVTSHSATIIDHVWCNFTIPHKADAIITSVTDHYPVFTLFPNVLSHNSTPVKITFRDHSEYNVSLFLERVERFFHNYDFNENSNINDDCYRFHDDI